MSRLYIMQNHVGLIKIGRTGQNVEARRRAIERDDAYTIKIVAVIEDGGDFEEIMLANLDEQQVIVEWYEDRKSVVQGKKMSVSVRHGRRNLINTQEDHKTSAYMKTH